MGPGLVVADQNGDVQLPGEGNRPVLERPRTEELPMQPPEEKEEPLPLTQEVHQETREEPSPEAEGSVHCVVSVVGLGVCVAGLSASASLPPRRRRTLPWGDAGE